jgi:hypothetical protein
LICETKIGLEKILQNQKRDCPSLTVPFSLSPCHSEGAIATEESRTSTAETHCWSMIHGLKPHTQHMEAFQANGESTLADFHELRQGLHSVPPNQTSLLSPPRGRSPSHPQTKHTLGNSTPHHAEKKSTQCPLPLGEGQTDTPINRHNRGEVALYPHSRFRAIESVQLVVKDSKPRNKTIAVSKTPRQTNWLTRTITQYQELFR